MEQHDRVDVAGAELVTVSFEIRLDDRVSKIIFVE